MNASGSNTLSRGGARTNADRGCIAFTRVELAAALAALALMGAVALPAVSKPREAGRRVLCVNNLRQIAHGWLMWSLDHGGLTPPLVTAGDGGAKSNANIYAHFLAASNEIGPPTVLICPTEARPQVANTWAELDSPGFRNNAVGYFAGLHVGYRTELSFLAGDPNLTGQQMHGWCVAAVPPTALPHGDLSVGWRATNYHRGNGNVAMSDGRVLQLTSTGLRRRLPVGLTEAYRYEHLLLPP